MLCQLPVPGKVAMELSFHKVPFCLCVLLASCLAHGASGLRDAPQPQQLIASLGEFASRREAAAKHDPHAAERMTIELATKMQDATPGLWNPAIAAIAAAAGRQPELLESDTCARNWASPCPDGWVLAAGAACIAPSWMRDLPGGCPGTLSAEMELEDKVALAERCRSPWPCVGACKNGLDYLGCPDGYARHGERCVATAQRRCPQIPVQTLDVAGIQAATGSCGLRWGCQAVCQQNTSAPCPAHWAEGPHELCTPPVAYSGPCGATSLRGLRPGQKVAFSRKCLAPWPCAGPGMDSPPREPLPERLLGEGQPFQAPSLHDGPLQ